MKLRIRGTTVRLRLTQSEVARFAEAGAVEETVPFPSASLSYQFRRSNAFAADFKEGILTVTVPAEAAAAWTETEQVGIEFSTNGLNLLIEKDFQCAHGPADLDAFEPERLSLKA